MTQAERIISVCHRALDPGPMGAFIRGSFYKAFTAVGRDQDISKVKTSCAVFVHAVLHWAGRLDKKPDVPGMGIFNGWLERLSYAHPAWEDSHDSKGAKRQPPPGAICYRAYTKASGGQESHVEILLFETSPGMWFVASGGSSPDPVKDKETLKHMTTAEIKATNGTLCRITAAPKDVFKSDSLGRQLIGWWRPELLDDFVPEGSEPEFPKESSGAEPAPPAETPAEPAGKVYDASLVTYTGRYVRELQDLLGLRPLDGKLGPATLAAIKKALNL